MPHTSSQEITAGEELAEKIKKAFYAEEPWTPKLAHLVGYTMSAFKRAVRPAFSELDELAFLRRVGGFTVKDIQEAFEDFGLVPIRMEAKCKENQPNAIGALLGNSTATKSS